MGKSTGGLSPAVTAAIVVVAIIIAVAGGVWFLNKPPKDAIADAVHRERGSSDTTAAPKGPMGGAPPKAGASDYANPSAMPSAPAGR